MFYAKLDDRDNPKNNCIAEFETARVRNNWCKKYTDWSIYFIWEPITKKEAATYCDLSKFDERECNEIGRGCDNRIVFAIDI